MRFTLTEYLGPRIVTATVLLEKDRLCLDYQVDDPGVRWAPFARYVRSDNLWQDTCLELFIGDADDHQYWELNLAPHGGWNCYRLTGYRTGITPSDDFELLNLDVDPQRFRAELRFGILPERMTIGPSAVIREGEKLAYFALQHQDKPDFHDRTLHQVIDRRALYT